MRKSLEYEAPKPEYTVQGQGYGGIWSNHGRTETPLAATPSETPASDAATPSETTAPVA